MSMRPDGGHECDRCAADVGNGGLDRALLVADLDPDRPGMVRNLHFCRDRVDGDQEVRGCARKLLAPSNLRALTGRAKSARG